MHKIHAAGRTVTNLYCRQTPGQVIKMQTCRNKQEH
jgi:hypothetical protein